MGRGGSMGMGARPQMSSPGIRNIPPVVNPTIPTVGGFGHNSIRNIPPVVNPTIPRTPGFSTGLRDVGRTGFGFRAASPLFSAAAGQAVIGPSLGYYNYAPYGYSYPYPYYPYPFTYVQPLTTTSPYYSAPIYPEATVNPSYSVNPSYGAQPATDALVGEIQDLQNQVQQLSDELAMRSKPEPPPPPAPREPETPVVLVFRDGHQIETHGYAIMGTMLWAVDGTNVSKFPLSDLNIKATQSANQKRGIDFKLPE